MRRGAHDVQDSENQDCCLDQLIPHTECQRQRHSRHQQRERHTEQLRNLPSDSEAGDNERHDPPIQGIDSKKERNSEKQDILFFGQG